MSNTRVIILAVLAVLIISVCDFNTGWEVSLFVFYAFPIFFVGYQVNGRLGIAFACVCDFLWWLGNRAGNPYQTQIAFIWSTLTRAAYMLFVAYGANLLRRFRETERERIQVLAREAELRKDMLNEIEEQQRFFGRELHDGVCQLLSGTALAMDSLARRLDAKIPGEAGEARQVEGYLRKALAEARMLAHGLFPIQMGSEGLPVALDELAEMNNRPAEGVRVTFSQNGSTLRLSSEASMHLYRIAQEALGNSIQHSKARNITVTLRSGPNVTELEIADDGVGMASGPDPGIGIGLRTMAYRAEQIGARLEVSARQPKGTRVICLISAGKPDSALPTDPQE